MNFAMSFNKQLLLLNWRMEDVANWLCVTCETKRAIADVQALVLVCKIGFFMSQKNHG